LAKKYGTAVRLLLVTATEEAARNSNDAASGTTFPNNTPNNNNKRKRDESWYRLRPEETGSGVVHLLSSEFDPFEALTRASMEDVSRANPWMEGSSILDNVGKCATLLPEDDPLRRDSHHQLQLRKATASSKHSGTMMHASLPAESSSNNNNNNKDTKKGPRNDLHPFEAIASLLDSGPHSLLFRLREERKRVRIVVRYVNMVRGTLSGTLIAFDKHMNMILRDVEEVYSPRLIDEENHKSNLDLELERRRRVRVSIEGKRRDDESLFDKSGEQHQLSQQPGTWNVRRRQMKQIMVRGDMVVSIYEADQEKLTVTTSRYHKRKARATNSNVNDDNNNAKRRKGDERNNKPQMRCSHGIGGK
jgi:small nuclear ribonucleoprotein (snRNP)-like protein